MRDEASDDDMEGDEAVVRCTLSANVSHRGTRGNVVLGSPGGRVGGSSWSAAGVKVGGGRRGASELLSDGDQNER